MDGAGHCEKTRKVQLNWEELWNAATNKENTFDQAMKYIDYIAYIQVPLMGDLKSEWDIRCSGKDQYLIYIPMLCRHVS